MGEHGRDARLRDAPSAPARTDANAGKRRNRDEGAVSPAGTSPGECRVSAPGWRRAAGGNDEMQQEAVPLAPNGARPGPVGPTGGRHAYPPVHRRRSFVARAVHFVQVFPSILRYASYRRGLQIQRHEAQVDIHTRGASTTSKRKERTTGHDSSLLIFDEPQYELFT